MANSNDSDNRKWTKDGWKTFPIKQQPDYQDKAALASALETIRRLPPLVHQNEVKQLRSQLAEVYYGKRFLLQGGDCAERFMDCQRDPIEAKLKILLQMSLILTWGGKIPTVRVGRVAGQYGKPRSSPVEKQTDGSVLPSFKGDNINGFEGTAQSRFHDPMRLVAGHFHSAATINYIRALIRGGFGDLHQSHHWDLGGVRDDWKRRRYEDISNTIREALEFMEISGVQTVKEKGATEVDFFTSHEGLVLDYEDAVTYFISNESASNGSGKGKQSEVPSNTQGQGQGQYFNLGAHFLWIGNRTRSLNDAHVEYFRGIENPIGIKVDSETKLNELIALIQTLDPSNSPGKITLISRFGHDKIWNSLPQLVKGVSAAGLKVIWSCDPMHGNTYSTEDGIKTRNFDHILNELTATFQVHRTCGSHLGGVHFELTGEDVTECVGGPQQLGEACLKERYTTYCDPRLNYLQSMELAFLLADLLKSNGRYPKGTTDQSSETSEVRPIRKISSAAQLNVSGAIEAVKFSLPASSNATTTDSTNPKTH